MATAAEVGNGFLPPIMRMYGGLLTAYALLPTADRPVVSATLLAAAESVNWIATPMVLPRPLVQQLANLQNSIRLHATRLSDHTEDVARENLKELLRLAWLLAGNLDEELVGLEGRIVGTTP
jgi:hypothetical protein